MSLFRKTEVRRQQRSQAGFALSYAIVLSGGVAGVALVVGLGSTTSVEPEQPSQHGSFVSPGVSPTADPDIVQLINTYCAGCHNEQRRTADLVLDTVEALDPGADPDKWEKMAVRLRTGTMPPNGMPRPERETYVDVAEWLEMKLDSAYFAHPSPDPGVLAAVHRLNRTEYNNAINDLLALDVDVRDQLPGDETSDGSFDNFAADLTISPAHVERYLTIARNVSRLAVGLVPAAASSDRYVVSDARPQRVRMGDNLPIGSRGGLAVEHHFPVEADYLLTIRLQKNFADYIRGMGWKQDLDVRLDGELLQRFTVGGGVWNYRPSPHGHEGAGDGPGSWGASEWEEYMQVGAEQHLQVRMHVAAGPHLVTVSFPRDVWEDESVVLQPPVQARSMGDAVNAKRMSFAGVREVYIEGPYDAVGTARDTPSRRAIFTCEPVNQAFEEESCATEILSRLARRAYRQTAVAEEVQTLLEFFHQGREVGGSFDHGIQLAIERLLVDPSFLLRVYKAPQRAPQEIPENPQEPYVLSGFEVATRLAFFLWSSLPDDTLLDLAEAGRLVEPAILRQQVERLLQDPRAHDNFGRDFAGQWFSLGLLEQQDAADGIYIEFDDNLRAAMRQETELFVSSTVREDRSVLDLVRADYTYANERLARHYGIPNVAGSHFRRVTLPNLEERGGVLGHASILSVTSYPDRTTPVLRGKWLLQNMLGMKVLLPPSDVDTSLEEEGRPGAGSPSIRERLAAHRTEPRCAGCHSVLDPLGFALEGYDATGGYRALDERGNPVDDIGTWPTGEEVRGLSGLRGILLANQELFARTVTGKLMEYGLGRRIEAYDQPMVRKIVRDAAAEDYRWSDLIIGIVESRQFLMGTLRTGGSAPEAR
jgi:hypothetical protein